MSRKTAKPSSDDTSRNRDQVIQRVFEKHYKSGDVEVPFTITDIREAIMAVAEARPGYKEDNVPDVRYEYTSGRRPLPNAIDRLGPWMIAGRGKARYAFVKLTTSPAIDIQDNLLSILLPSVVNMLPSTVTPGMP